LPAPCIFGQARIATDAGNQKSISTKKAMRSLNNWNKADAENFIRGCIVWIGPAFHPDTPMADYIGKDGAIFTPNDAYMNQCKLEKALDILGDDIYGIGLDMSQTMGFAPRQDLEESNGDEKEKMFWRCDINSIVREIVENNKGVWAMRMPLQILLRMLYDLGQIALRVNDPELNAMMLRLAIYEDGDYNKNTKPESRARVDQYIRDHSKSYK
jgi:hypothetical protein